MELSQLDSQGPTNHLFHPFSESQHHTGLEYGAKQVHIGRSCQLCCEDVGAEMYPNQKILEIDVDNLRCCSLEIGCCR